MQEKEDYVLKLLEDAGLVTHSQIEKVRQYILNQEEHHRRKSFREEYLEILRLSGIEYDERYVW